MSQRVSVPNYVRAWRERAGMTQDALASAVGSGKASELARRILDKQRAADAPAKQP